MKKFLLLFGLFAFLSAGLVSSCAYNCCEKQKEKCSHTAKCDHHSGATKCHHDGHGCCKKEACCKKKCGDDHKCEKKESCCKKSCASEKPSCHKEKKCCHKEVTAEGDTLKKCIKIIEEEKHIEK